MIRKAIIVVLTLLSVLASALWWASYRRVSTGYAKTYWGVEFVGGYEWEWHLRPGELQFGYAYNVPRNSVRKNSFSSSSFLGTRVSHGTTVHGSGSRHTLPLPRSEQTASRSIHVWLPLWLPTAFFAPYPTIAFVRGPVRRWRRRKRGECVGCGYNRAGNESGICPECGMPI